MNAVKAPSLLKSDFLEDAFYNKPLFETTHFKVIPSLGSLLQGWLLIVPKEFYISFGEIRNPGIYKELNLLINNLQKVIKTLYGDSLLFEHGPIIKKSLVGCSVDYAHLHIVPISINLIRESAIFLNKKIFWSSASGIENTLDYYNNGLPYLFFRDVNNNSFIGTSEELPSQLFRKTIAKHIGIEEKYDWKQYPFTDNINKTIELILEYNKQFPRL